MNLTIKEVMKEWKSKNRRMCCVSASNWLCKRLKGYYPLRLTRTLENGDIYQHVISTNGIKIIDLAKYTDKGD